MLLLVSYVGAPTVADAARAGHHGPIRGVSLLALAALACATGAGAREPAVLVSFEQTGGFAGIERSLAVHRSGKVVSDGLPVKTARLTPARLRALR